ncbi:MAG: NUDIX domain-containing protein, partial [Candidatus Sungbacteria bacterium]|nr:NUDIX domain-containing protein [Candidatus Sungbacteria bacterium]
MNIQKIKREKEYFPKEYRAYGRGIKRVEYANEKGSFLIHTQRPSVMVVAFTGRKEIILLKKFERGPRRWVWGIPGGGVDTGDRGSSRRACERELCEEANVHAKRLRYIGDYYDDVYSTG